MKVIDEFEECMHKLRFIERIRSDAEIAKVLDMPISTFSDHRSRRELPIEKLLNYCEKKSVNIDWLMLKQAS